MVCPRRPAGQAPQYLRDRGAKRIRSLYLPSPTERPPGLCSPSATRPGLARHYQCCDYAPLQSRPPCPQPTQSRLKAAPTQSRPAPLAGRSAPEGLRDRLRSTSGTGAQSASGATAPSPARFLTTRALPPTGRPIAPLGHRPLPAFPDARGSPLSHPPPAPAVRRCRQRQWRQRSTSW